MPISPLFHVLTAPIIKLQLPPRRYAARKHLLAIFGTTATHETPRFCAYITHDDYYTYAILGGSRDGMHASLQTIFFTSSKIGRHGPDDDFS